MKFLNVAAATLLTVSLIPCEAFAQVGDTVDTTSAVVAPADAIASDSVLADNNVSTDNTSSLTVSGAATPPGTNVPDSALTEVAQGTAPAQGTDVSALSDEDDEGGETDADKGVKAFANRLYNLVLGREADEAGLAVQVDGIKSMGAGQVALNFFDSKEFQATALSYKERVEIAYETMLDRPSDEAGLALWLSYLENGMSIDAVVVGFAESPEFAQLCAAWEVDPGNVGELRSHLAARDQNPKITAYAHRLYELVLNRSNPEPVELDFQCQALLDGVSASQLAMNFFNAQEFTDRGLTPEDQVELAYRTLLDRSSDEEGFAFWVAGFDYLMTVESVVAGFANAEEFRANCAEWGVDPGSVEIQLARNKSQVITRAIYETYELAFDRVPDEAGLDYWCGVCEERGLIWVCEGFLQSEEVSAKATTNEERVALAYRICLGREGEDEGIVHWAEYLGEGYNMYALLARFCESEEYLNRCTDLGVPAGKLAYYAVSTNHTLNLMITEIVENITGLDAYQCYLYTSTFTYYRRGLWPSYDGWMEDYAINFINDGGGNCYGYASLFAFLARACGYHTGVHQGQTTSSSGATTPHGWCEVYVDGQTLVVDPDLYHELGIHCFMLPYGLTPLTLYL